MVASLQLLTSTADANYKPAATGDRRRFSGRVEPAADSRHELVTRWREADSVTVNESVQVPKDIQFDLKTNYTVDGSLVSVLNGCKLVSEVPGMHPLLVHLTPHPVNSEAYSIICRNAEGLVNLTDLHVPNPAAVTSL